MFFYSEKIDKLLEVKVEESYLSYSEENVFIGYLRIIKAAVKNVFKTKGRKNVKERIVFFPRETDFVKSYHQGGYDKYIYKNYSINFYGLIKISILGFFYLLKYILISNKKLARKTIRSFLTAKIISYDLKLSKIQYCWFYGYSYNLTTFFLSFLCYQKKVPSRLFINHLIIQKSDAIIVDEVLVENKWSANAVSKIPEIICKRVQVKNEDKRIAFKKIKKENVAVYSSGTYNRKPEFHKMDSFEENALLEAKAFRVVYDYAKKQNDINFTIFIHPNVETIESATAQFSSILQLPNVRLQEKNMRSKVFFDKFGLGIATFSTVLLDRLTLGYKSVFLNPGQYKQDLYRLGFEEIVVDESDNINKKLDWLRSLDTEEYFKLLD